jgi:hypothetical protein
MAKDTSSGSFDCAPWSFMMDKLFTRSAQDDRVKLTLAEELLFHQLRITQSLGPTRKLKSTLARYGRSR